MFVCTKEELTRYHEQAQSTLPFAPFQLGDLWYMVFALKAFKCFP